MGEPFGAEKVVRQFMAAFIAAWPTGNASELARFFSDDAAYHNGPLKPVHGREAIVADFAQQMSLGGSVSVDIRHLVTDGTIVMTERVDYLKLGERTIHLRTMGIFEVRHGVITAWRDYFDGNEFPSQMLEG